MESLRPDISVLLPVRQWRETTLTAVVSLLNQSCESLEVLILGQDNLDSLKARLPTDNRLRYIARKMPGIVGALNTGLANARAPYIARMDDDDISYVQRFEIQLDYLRNNPEVDLCGARIRFVDQQGKSDSIRRGNQQYAQWLNSLTNPAQIHAAGFVECPLPHPTLFAHREVWRKLNGYRELDGPEDYDLILRAMLQGMNMGKPEEILLDWREHAQRLTYSDRRYRREAFTQRKAWAAVQPQSNLGLYKGRSVWLCGTGRNARQWHDALTMHGVAVEGFVDFNREGPERHKRSLPVIGYEDLTTRRGDALVITTLTQPSAREELMKYFTAHEWQTGRDFILGG